MTPSGGYAGSDFEPYRVLDLLARVWLKPVHGEEFLECYLCILGPKRGL